MIDLAQKLSLRASITAALRQVYCHIIPKSMEKGCTKGFATPQYNTTDRSAITVEEQFCWNTLINEQFKQMRLKNTGLCNLSNKTFGEEMVYFVWDMKEESTCDEHNENVKNNRVS